MADSDIEAMKKQIEETRQRIELQKQINELKELQKQAMPVTVTQNPNDPMQRMLKWAFPAGIILAGSGMALDIMFAQFALGLLLVAFGAVAIGIKVASTPSMKIPFIDKPKPEQPKQQPANP